MKNNTPAIFPAHEREQLLALKGVGKTVIARLEEMGFASLADLRGVDVQDILDAGAHLTQSTCWKNSPQARAAIQAVLQLAKQA